MHPANFNQLKTAIGPVVQSEGQEYLYFGGTAYLGIPQNPDFLKLYCEGLSLYGINNGTSRSNNIQLEIYEAAEYTAAQRFGAEAALIASSGYLAAQLLVRHYAEQGTVVYAPHTHPALWLHQAPGTAGSFPDWAREAAARINDSKQTQWLLLSNSLNNLFPEPYDFSFLKDILPENNIILIVDDSHGIGVLNHGQGVYSQIPRADNIETVVVASMAKALGVDAGIILGTQKAISALKTRHEFIGASPPAAAGLYAFMNAGPIYQAELDKLRALMAVFSAAVPAKGWTFFKDYPVYLSADTRLFEKLLRSGILISSFPYPDQAGPALNRIVLSSWTSTENIQVLLKAIAG